MNNKMYGKKNLSWIVLLTGGIVLGLFGLAARTDIGGPGKSSKKGACLTVRDNWLNKLTSLHPSWHYSWGPDLKDEEPAGIDFVPMIWGRQRVNAEDFNKLKALKQAGRIHYLLGFNEPDQQKQSNMSVEEALSFWPQLMDVHLPLGSPACAKPLGTWMRTFMKAADSLGYRIDFVTVHWYGGNNVDSFIDRLKEIHQLYGRPIWITEFAVGDWKAKTIEENKNSPEEVLAFMKKALPILDTLSFVKRYAWFSSDPSNPHIGSSSLINRDGSLTALGKYYASH